MMNVKGTNAFHIVIFLIKFLKMVLFPQNLRGGINLVRFYFHLSLYYSLHFLFQTIIFLAFTRKEK